MAQATGLSYLYPAVPIMNFLAMVSMLLLAPAFWKTRIVALVALIGWFFVGNLLQFIGMIHWRGHANDALVLASILIFLRRAKNCGNCMSSACFAHFTWQRLQPLPVRKLYDTRRRNNLIHLFFTLILPVLWAPLSLFSCPSRYIIIEDLGPDESSRHDWPGFVAVGLPQLLGYAAFGIFNVLALVSYWQMKREDVDSDIPNPHSSVRTRKLLAMTVINTGLGAYSLYWQITNFLNAEWVTPLSLTENIASLQTVLAFARSDLDTYHYNETSVAARAGILLPLLTFYVFAWFGLGAEARKAYGEALLKLGRLIGATFREHWPHPSTLPFSWSTIALWKANLQQRLANALFLIQRNAPQITPYISTVPPDNGLQVPLSPTRIPPSNPVGDRINAEGRGTAPSREPAHRWSIRKPPLAASDLANAIPSVPYIPLRRLSHHKPPLVPLASPNTPVGATPGASGSTPPREEAANNIRQQEKFAPPPRPRRLSFHKPAFVPSAPANSAGPNASRATIPLVEIPRDLIGERNAVLRAENSVEESMAPSPLSIASPSTALSPFSTPSTATPVPPYRDVSPFHDHVPLASANPTNTIPPVAEVPLRRLSHHKPRLVPSTPSNTPATATPGTSGNTPARAAAANNTRRHETFALRPRARRLSYHKPAFEPLASADANSAMPNGMGPTIPLAEIPMDIIGERNAVLQAESVVESTVALSAVSTSTPPPSFLTSSTATPAPPYQGVNPFLHHAH